MAKCMAFSAELPPFEPRCACGLLLPPPSTTRVQMTEKTLYKAFESNGLKRLWPLDEKFDPNLHDALFEMPDPNKEAGTVGHVASAGYMLHDRVIRAAGVGVIKAS